nr:diacylglycerol kinase 5-like [Ipomoea batatas]
MTRYLVSDLVLSAYVIDEEIFSSYSNRSIWSAIFNVQGKKNPGTYTQSVLSFLIQVKDAKEMNMDRFCVQNALFCLSRAQRDAAARAMQGWHEQRLLRYGLMVKFGMQEPEEHYLEVYDVDQSARDIAEVEGDSTRRTWATADGEQTTEKADGLWLWKCIRGKFWALWFEPHSGLGYSSQDLAMGRQGHAYVWWLWIGHGKERMVQDLHFRVDDEDTS